MLEATEALQEYDDIKEEYTTLLEKKMKVPHPSSQVDSRNAILLRKI